MYNTPTIRNKIGVLSLYIILFGSQLFFLLLLNSFMWPFVILYIIYIIFDKSAFTGSKRCEYMRSSNVWKWIRDYFPIQIIKTYDLDPKEKYIFGYHPHGVLSTGALINFATEATDFSVLFPGIKNFLVASDFCFYLPLFREFYMLMGLASCSKKSLKYLLSKGNSCTLVIGGVKEALLCDKDKVDLILKERLGFVKMALETGANLVPIYGFNENCIFDKLKPSDDSFVNKIMILLKRIIGINIPLFYGQGFDSKNPGFLPKAIPLSVIVGKPLKVVKTSNPDIESIEFLHKLYMEALEDLYNTHKDHYSFYQPAPRINLI